MTQKLRKRKYSNCEKMIFCHKVKSRRGYKEVWGSARGGKKKRRKKRDTLVMQKFHNIPPQFHPRLPAEAKRTFLCDRKPPGPQPRVDWLTTTGPELLKILFRYASRSASVCVATTVPDRMTGRSRKRDSNANHGLGASSSDKKVEASVRGELTPSRRQRAQRVIFHRSAGRLREKERETKQIRLGHLWPRSSVLGPWGRRKERSVLAEGRRGPMPFA